jgi:hypothetical protein
VVGPWYFTVLDVFVDDVVDDVVDVVDGDYGDYVGDVYDGDYVNVLMLMMLMSLILPW